ncbi:hypothetical protein [Aquiflexum sp.]|uniref:hypothetical protein n=1 Tax=Aquiflexum sp. TaxID=1872584 RepID=UPI0035944F45
MKEQFDKRLVDKIKVSFQQHEEPLDPQELEKFKKLYLGQKNKGFKRIGAFWWMSFAASLVLGVLLFNQFQITKTNQNEDSPELLTSKEQTIIDEQFSTQDQKEDPKRGFGNKLENESNRGEQENLRRTTVEFQKAGADKDAPHLGKIIGKESLKSKSILADNKESINKTDKGFDANEPFIDASRALSFKDDSETEQKSLDYIKNWLGEDLGVQEKQMVAMIEKKNDPVKLGVLVAPQTISNTTQTLSLGAGMMSEFSFSKRLKLDVGLAYARQQITPTTSSRNSLRTSDAVFTNTQSSAALSEAARAAFSGNFINASTELSFGQLEIPINLKYKVLENKNSDVYLISGFSNMMYLNQQNTTTFSTANLNQGNFVGLQPAIQTYSQTESPNSGSGNVDSGQMLNFGFGYEQNLKNGTFLSIEPFYKFSLGDQTFNNQQFSIGGINLRMNFQLKNKKE